MFIRTGETGLFAICPRGAAHGSARIDARPAAQRAFAFGIRQGLRGCSIAIVLA